LAKRNPITALIAFAPLVGCSLVFDLNGYVGPPLGDGGSLGDASGDVGGDGDGALDASFDSQADVADGCVGFCDDFDDRSTLKGAWKGVSATGRQVATNATITTKEFVSPPHSAWFHVVAQDGGSGTLLYLSVDTPMPTPTLVLDLDVKITGRTAFTGFVNLAQLSVGGLYVGGLTALSTNENIDRYVNLADGGRFQDVQFVNAADEGWHHLHYEATYDPVNGSVLATWDQTKKVIDFHGQTLDTPRGATKSLLLGAIESNAVADMDVYFDNVVFR
jgi:hypothetical protein